MTRATTTDATPEDRREELAEAAWRCVAYEGLESATIRSVASEAGASTGRVVHYFRSKDELLLAALRHASRKFARRIEGRLANLEGLAAVEALIREELPLDEDRRAEWRVWLAFWSRGSVKAELAEENRRRLITWREQLLGLLRQAVAHGELNPGLDLSALSEQIIAMVSGLGVQAMFAPDLLTPERIDEHVQSLLRELRTRGGSE